MNIKTFSVVALVAAAVSSPVLAQDTDGSATQKPAHALRHYRGAYNQVGSESAALRAYDGGSVHNDVDHSWVGGRDPSFNPSGS